jgi:hypothetical protein
MNMFAPEAAAGTVAEFALNGSYWQLLSFCCAMGGATMLISSMAGQAVMQVERMRLWWILRHYTWRVFLAWAAGMFVFWLIH